MYFAFVLEKQKAKERLATKDAELHQMLESMTANPDKLSEVRLCIYSWCTLTACLKLHNLYFYFRFDRRLCLKVENLVLIRLWKEQLLNTFPKES